MLGAQEFGNPMKRGVIDQNRGQQSLLGLDIGRRLAVKRLALAQRQDIRRGIFHDGDVTKSRR